jgi:hypothetical protein
MYGASRIFDSLIGLTGSIVGAGGQCGAGKAAVFRWYRKRLARHELAIADAKKFMLRYGVRAHQEVRFRVTQMHGNAVIDANRPACHWKRVRRLIASCLPDDFSNEPLGSGRHISNRATQ